MSESQATLEIRHLLDAQSVIQKEACGSPGHPAGRPHERKINMFKLPDLPYSKKALSPSISAETLEYHHGKHHAGYVKKLNELARGTKFEQMSLEEVIMAAEPGPLFNNAAQHWNHSFYWNCLSPEKMKPRDNIAEALKKSFNSVDEFRKKFNEEAEKHFGSGWAWLTIGNDGQLAIETTHDANLPLKKGRVALLTCDIWEHAYYIDYRNERKKYLEQFWKIVNWDFVAENFERRSSEVLNRHSQMDDQHAHM